MNVAVGMGPTKDASEFSIRRGCRRPSTINAVGTERGAASAGKPTPWTLPSVVPRPSMREETDVGPRG